MGIALTLPRKLFWSISATKPSPNDEHNSSISKEATKSSFQTERTSSTSIGSITLYSFGSGISTDEAYLSGRILNSTSIKIFTYNELKKATRNFNLENSLGHGGFGTVFKGWVDQKTLKPAKMGHGMAVAVKKMNSEGRQGFQEWQSEVNFLGSLSHPNLVKLLGYCWDKKKLLLVYEFMSKGSLENHLFRKGTNSHQLPWDLRLKIATDAARGLEFLHSSDEKIIYRDFKASNILLDSNYNAKISDFGLAKNGPSVGETHVSTRVVGTIGYAAPEYVLTGHLYVKSDVYGFGVVLLELLTGQRAYDTERNPHKLVEWAKQLLSSRKTLPPHFMDPQLEGRYSSNRAARAVDLALRCIEIDPNNRPSMNEVLENLQGVESRNSQRELESLSYRRTPLRNRSSNLS